MHNVLLVGLGIFLGFGLFLVYACLCAAATADEEKRQMDDAMRRRMERERRRGVSSSRTPDPARYDSAAGEPTVKL